jgi:two-component system, OmpR family, sensor histidine kinase KdpD
MTMGPRSSLQTCCNFHTVSLRGSFLYFPRGGIYAVPHARFRSAALVLLASAFLIFFGIVANQHLNLAATISVYLFITLAIADKAGFVEASIVSIVATLCLEYFFAPPIFSFRVDRPEDWTALAAFEGISLMVSRLSDQARRHQVMLKRQSIEQKALYELCRDMLLLDWKQSPDRQLCVLIKRSFPLQGVALWNAYEGAFSSFGQTPNAEDAVKAVYFSERNYDDASNNTSYRVLYFGTRAVGALMFYEHSIDSLSINSIASVTAMAIERTRSLAVEMNLEAEKHSEQLRSALLDGLAHAFKTPLTTITVASSGLLAAEKLDTRQAGLVDLINREATRLSQLTTRLLRTSRLEPSQLIVHEKVIDIQTLIQGVLDECASELISRRVDVTIAQEITTVQCDPQLFTMALVQILDNAAKYAPQDSLVQVSVDSLGSQTVFRIHNHGSYIPPAERNKVFTRFYRSPSVEHCAPGTGLGLSVAKKAIEAHGGKISIESDMQAGTTFVITIPATTEELT